MRNPIVEVREATGTTIQELADRSGITRSVIENLEAGLFTKVPRTVREVLRMLQDEAGVDRTDIDTEYDRWIAWERLGVEDLPRPRATTPGALDSPAYWFRVDTMGQDNMLAFCKLLKVPPATIMRYEKGRTLAMPRVLEEALEACSYPHILELADRQERWNADAVASTRT